jgi:Zn-dependent protease with chaperone function
MIRINKHLGIFSGLFILLGFVSLFMLQKLSPLISHAAYYCESLIQNNITRIPSFLSIIPALVVFLILLVSFLKFFFLTLKVKFLQYKLKDKISNGSNIDKLIKRLGLEKKVVVIKSDKTFAFCLGIKSPKIYISSALIKKLSQEEVESVLRHEQYHSENHDTFTMIIASVTHSLIPFFPLFGDFIKKYRVNREIEADNFAVLQMGNSYHLRSALKKLLMFPTVGNAAIVAIADHDTLEPRIYALTNKIYNRRQFRLKHLFITLFSLSVIAGITVMPVSAKEIHHDHHDVVLLCTNGACMNSCTNNKVLNQLYSNDPMDKKPMDVNHNKTYTPIQ